LRNGENILKIINYKKVYFNNKKIEINQKKINLNLRKNLSELLFNKKTEFLTNFINTNKLNDEEIKSLIIKYFDDPIDDHLKGTLYGNKIMMIYILIIILDFYILYLNIYYTFSNQKLEKVGRN